MKGNHLPMCLLVLALIPILLGGVNVGLASNQGRSLLQGGAPTMVSYQGQVKVGGVLFSGTGYFKFAILDALGAYKWSNDGTDGAPIYATPLTVSGGLFNVLLGDTSLEKMNSIDASVFNGPTRFLRIWFSTNNSTFTQLIPDQRIAAVPYALQASALEGLHANDFQQKYDNYIVVAKSGGDFTSVNDALLSINDAGYTNRYLVKVMPGEYYEQVTMKEYVDIEGSGELITKISWTGDVISTTATLTGANDAELRWLTIENSGDSTYAVAIYNYNTSPQLTHVTVSASGGTYNYVIFNKSASPELANVKVSCISGDKCYGLFNVMNSSPTMSDSSITIEGGSEDLGVYNDNSSMSMVDVNINSSGTTLCAGVFNYYSSVTILNSTVVVSGSSQNYGVFGFALSGTHIITVNNSQIIASTNTIIAGSEYIIHVGASLLAGGSVSSTGQTSCAGVYDGGYNFHASTCP